MKKKLLALLFIAQGTFAAGHSLTNNIFVNIDPSYSGEPAGVYVETTSNGNKTTQIFAPGEADVGLISSGIITVYNIPDGTHCYPNTDCKWQLPAQCIQMINTPDQYKGPVVMTGFINPTIPEGITTLDNLECHYQY